MLLLANILVLALIGCQLLNFPGDVVRESLTLEEAQNLVTFSICAPAYIPSAIDPQPNIIFHDDGFGAEQEKFIRHKYYFKKSKELALEVSQRISNRDELPMDYSEEQLTSIRDFGVNYHVVLVIPQIFI